MKCRVLFSFLPALVFPLTNMDCISYYLSPTCSEIKERIKKTKDEKKAKKAEVASKAQKSGKGNVQKGGLPKGPKLGGGGGKR